MSNKVTSFFEFSTFGNIMAGKANNLQKSPLDGESPKRVHKVTEAENYQSSKGSA